jgi:hypothetical protein
MNGRIELSQQFEVRKIHHEGSERISMGMDDTDEIFEGVRCATR